MANLVADIGGTNARFGLWDASEQHLENSARLSRVKYFLTSDFPSLAEAITAYCQDPTIGHQNIQLRHLSLAVAGPVEKDWVTMSNNSWSFSKAELKKHLGLECLTVINDFTAQALLPPALGKSEKQLIRTGTPIAGTPIAILGPGTGLGMSALVPLHQQSEIQPVDKQRNEDSKGADKIAWRPLETEGGNVPFAPRTPEELALMQFVMDETGRTVSFEDILSGRGLERAYRFCTPSAPALSAADITAHAADNPTAKQAIFLFLNCLSNFVLTAIMMTGARQGVYLSGGIIPRLLPFFAASEFDKRLTEYGIFTDYISSVPIWLITAQEPGLTGAGLALSNPYIQHRKL